MSTFGDLKSLVDVFEAKSALNAQNLIKSLITFPDDLNLTGEEQVLNDPTNNMDLDDQHSGILTPIRTDRSGTSTPSLSLPDSFDVDVLEATRAKKAAQRLPGRFPVQTRTATTTCPRCGETEEYARLEKAAVMNKCSELTAALEATKLNNEATNAELVRVQRMAGITEENQRQEIVALTDRCLRLANMNETETALRRQLEDRAARCDLAEAELQRLRKETAELRATLDQQGKVVQSLTLSENAARRASEDATRVHNLLTLDKAHLQQELRAMESKYNDKCRAAEASQSQCLALEVKVAQLTDQLLSLQLTARSGFDERMDKEIQRLREENARELEALKATSRDILDRENRVLREAKASIENECNQLRQRNDALSQQLALLQQELVNTAQDKNNVVSDLRAELKMKGFELTTLGVTFEERMVQLRRTEAELEVVRQEMAAHKTALLRLETESQQTEQRLRAELTESATRLRAYESLEEEVDQAVLRTADLYGAGPEGEGGAGGDLVGSAEEASRRLLQRVKGIPTNPERRVKQAVFLAQRLLEAERQRDAAKAELKQVRAEMAVVQKQADVAAENLTRAAQPTSYLVTKLRDEENGKAAFVSKCKVLEEELQRCRQAELASRKEAENLRERLRVTLQNRGALETLKVMVAQWCAQDDDDGEGGSGEGMENDTSSGEEGESGSESDGSDRGHRRGKGAGRGDRGRAVEFSEERKQASRSPPSSRGSRSPDTAAGVAATSTVQIHTQTHMQTPTKAARPAGDLMTTAAALGLTPEQIKEMTSPPRR